MKDLQLRTLCITNGSMDLEQLKTKCSAKNTEIVKLLHSEDKKVQLMLEEMETRRAQGQEVDSEIMYKPLRLQVVRILLSSREDSCKIKINSRMESQNLREGSKNRVSYF